jgi:hypothetical protein
MPKDPKSKDTEYKHSSWRPASPNQGQVNAGPIRKLELVHTWEVHGKDDNECRTQGAEYFRKLLRDGIPHTDPRQLFQAPSRVWRFRGFPQFLAAQGARMRLPAAYAKKCEVNPELAKISQLLGQLSERFIKGSRLGGISAIQGNDKTSANDAIEICEQSVARLHLVAAAAAQAVDEARAAFGQSIVREFSVVSEYDEIVKSKPNGKSKKAEPDPPDPVLTGVSGSAEQASVV